MTGRVTPKRYEPVPDAILCGATTSSGRTWLPMAFLSNWLNGNGSQLIPGITIVQTVIGGGASAGIFEFQARTRLSSIERIWTLMVRGTVPGGVLIVQAPAGTGTSVGVVLDGARDIRMPIVYREILTAKSNAVETLTIKVVPFNGASGDIEIDSLTCHELARPLLSETGDDFGVNTETLRPRERIYSTGYGSVTGIVGGSYGDPRRVGLYQWAVANDNPIPIGAGAYTALLALPVPILTRKLNSGATTAKVYWSALVACAGASGDVKLTTSNSGVSSVVNFVNALPTAWTTPVAIDVDCEDMTDPAGLQGGVWDMLTIEVRGTGGDAYISALSIWDEAA